MLGIEHHINPLHLEDIRNPEHPSIFDENDAYDLLIIRLPVIADQLIGESYTFLLMDDSSYTYERTEKQFVDLGKRFEGPYKFLDAKIDILLKAFVSYQERIVDMEEALYENQIPSDLMNQWFHLKRNILRIERMLIRSSETFDAFIAYHEKSESFPIDHYVDLHEHTDRLKRSATLQLSKLDYIYNFYGARTNERMNRLVYLLTIISAIFLPLNLIVGFFGMNTSGLPFTQASHGTLSVSVIISVLFIAVSVLLYSIRNKS
jgi:magnesium transporter